MQRITVESIAIAVGREDDGRWWVDPSLCQPNLHS